MKRLRITALVRLASTVMALGMAVALTSCSAAPPGASTSPTSVESAKPRANPNSTTLNPLTPSEQAALKGKRILVVPYWLDAFGTAFGSWIERYYAKLGVSVTLVNTNAVASKQLNSISTAVASKQYAAVIWQPIDPSVAPTTVRSIQGAAIAQTLFNANFVPGTGGVHVPQVVFDTYQSLFNSGAEAAKFIKAHPSLGAHPRAAWLGSYPTIPFCSDQAKGLLAGLKSVDPQSQMVWNEGGADAAQSQRKVANMITAGTKFNVFDGCGSTQSLAGYAALKGAGLTTASNKVPTHVYILSQDAVPSELQLLWSNNSAMMTSNLVPPKDAATIAVNQVNAQLLKQIPPTSDEVAKVVFAAIGTDCAKYRAIVADQYLGVKGFSVPTCQG